MPKIPKKRGSSESSGKRISPVMGKKTVNAREQIERQKLYSLDEALALLTKARTTKFDQTVEIAFRLGVDPRKADQMVRGAMVLPNGLGKEMRVLVFAKGEKAQEALAAGADFVGAEELVDKIQKENWMDFNYTIATPDMMRHVGRIGKILGPRGLMPSPKVGTITTDIAKAVAEAKAGKVEFRVEKAGIIHAPVGKISFGVEKLKENIAALSGAILRLKPQTSKGIYLLKASVSATQSPGIKLDTALLASSSKGR